MKKQFLGILISIIISAVLMELFGIAVYYNLYRIPNIIMDISYKYTKPVVYYPFDFRPVVIPHEKTNKGEIILFGCSYTSGDGLKNNENFSYVLSEYTKRPVINLGLSGGGPKESLYIIEDDNFINEKVYDKNNVEYIIYTYIPDHNRRSILHSYIRAIVPNYVFDNNNKPVLKKSRVWERSFFLKVIETMYYEKYLQYYYPTKGFEKFEKYIDVLIDKSEKTFSYKNKKIQFVILIYYEDGSENWDNFKEKGIKVINLKEILDVNIIDEEYLQPDRHPNAKAWQVIVPALVKELKL